MAEDRTYLDYLEHQVSKLWEIQDTWLPGYNVKYREVLKERLAAAGKLLQRMTVLCLGARLGAEVRAFLDLGCFAVGIDINPGMLNNYVLYGDFHAIQFPDHSVDVIFTNSFDHAFDPEVFIMEIKRVLKLGGLLILEVHSGTKEGWQPDRWDVYTWLSIDGLLEQLTDFGFKVLSRADFEFPWPGQHIHLRMEA